MRAAAVAGGGRRSGRGAAAECDCDEAGAAHGWRLVGRANAGRAGEIASAAVRDPAPSRLASRAAQRFSSVSVFRNATMSRMSCSVIAGASPGLRSNGASATSTFARYALGMSSYCSTRPLASRG
ncbi:hypothetical protein BM44_4805 [Burkholderia mallei NCTC 10247]|nr:hypothetical protein DM55_4814 [Burkholderia mallei]AIS26860.1 hypothetical protein BM44_4805 [Burkholderia mallei NCTC 10247]AIO55995.1 hypothetical protein DM78_3174 [Burkholderia mallei]AIO61451.1 hypothetical protein DM76_3768 [Burkholderia mallei]AIP74867.1 hypothetical protein DM51_4328 [Burkholderia mallei]